MAHRSNTKSRTFTNIVFWQKQAGRGGWHIKIMCTLAPPIFLLNNAWNQALKIVALSNDSDLLGWNKTRDNDYSGVMSCSHNVYLMSIIQIGGNSGTSYLVMFSHALPVCCFRITAADIYLLNVKKYLTGLVFVQVLNAFI